MAQVAPPVRRGRPPSAPAAVTEAPEEDDETTTEVKKANARPIAPNTKVKPPSVDADFDDVASSLPPKKSKPTPPVDDEDDEDAPPPPPKKAKAAPAPSVEEEDDAPPPPKKKAAPVETVASVTYTPEQVAEAVKAQLSTQFSLVTKTCQVLADNLKDLQAEFKSLELSFREEVERRKDVEAKLLTSLSAAATKLPAAIPQEFIPEVKPSVGAKIPGNPAKLKRLCQENEIDSSVLDWITSVADKRVSIGSPKNRVTVQVVANSVSASLAKGGHVVTADALQDLLVAAGYSDEDGLLVSP